MMVTHRPKVERRQLVAPLVLRCLVSLPFFVMLVGSSVAFVPALPSALHDSRFAASGGKLFSSKDPINKYLKEFCTTEGELLDPYVILEISRKAELGDIKKAYYKLSRKYHPDSLVQRDILPGSCNDMDEVREHWERIRMSYEILKSPKLRTRYHRNEALADPAKAAKRAAVDAAFNGVASIGKGVFNLGSMAFNQAIKGGNKQ